MKELKFRTEFHDMDIVESCMSNCSIEWGEHSKWEGLWLSERAVGMGIWKSVHFRISEREMVLKWTGWLERVPILKLEIMEVMGLVEIGMNWLSMWEGSLIMRISMLSELDEIRICWPVNFGGSESESDCNLDVPFRNLDFVGINYLKLGTCKW